MKYNVKRALIAVCIVGIMINTSGCGEALQLFMKTDLVVQLQARFDANQACLDKLYNAGVVSEELYLKTSNNITVLKAKYNEIEESEKNTLIKALSAVKVYEKGECSDYTDDVDLNMLGNYVYKKEDHKLKSESKTDSSVKENNNFKEADAIRVIDNDSELNEISKYKIYVLKDSIALDGMDAIYQTVNGAISNKEVNSAILNEYFTDSGEELFSEEYIKDIIGITEPIDWDSDPADYKNKCGHDLVITQGGYWVAQVKLIEFNAEAVDTLIEATGLNSGKYVIDTKTHRAYLMEYPVQVIDTLSSNGSDVTATLKESDLGVNIRTGDIIKYDTASGNAKLTGNVIGYNIDNYTPYLTTYGADDNNAIPLASFSVGGSQTISIEDKLDKNGSSGTRDITTARFILRDYLEVTYAPDYLDGVDEDTVVLGRKLRFKFTDYTGDEVKLGVTNIASVVDANGEYILDANGNVTSLNAEHLMDLSGDIKKSSSRAEDTYIVNRLTKSGESDGQVIQEKSSNYSNPPKITELKIVANSKISPILRFPSAELDSGDYEESDNQPIFYTVGTCTDMFETGLYSGWIESTSTTASLSWWNTWLSNVGYSYGANKLSAEEYLMGNYSYELTQNGTIVIDLETVSKIQSDMDEISNQREDATRRTVFKVVGILLIAYSIILMLCWIIDTQLGLGIDLYTKASFGRWVAIKYKSDIPIGEHMSRYVSFGRMIVNTLIIMTMGILIIRLNIVALIYRLIKAFGTLSNKLSSMM